MLIYDMIMSHYINMSLVSHIIKMYYFLTEIKNIEF